MKKGTDLKTCPTAAMTEWIDVTIGDVKELLEFEKRHFLRKDNDEEKCPICQCELYDDINKMTDAEIATMTRD